VVARNANIMEARLRQRHMLILIESATVRRAAHVADDAYDRQPFCSGSAIRMRHFNGKPAKCPQQRGGSRLPLVTVRRVAAIEKRPAAWNPLASRNRGWPRDSDRRLTPGLRMDNDRRSHDGSTERAR
jgi:hypothetical protein